MCKTVKTVFFLYFLVIVNGSDDEYRLLNDLREGYDPIERPVVDHHKPLLVKFRLLLQQLVDVDEKNQVITLVAWIQYKWTDYKWKWDPEEYGNITKLQIPHGVLWKPDILLFNSANEHFDSSFPVNMVVSNNGSVLFAPPGIMQVSCALSMTWFPYDEQVCFLKFGSWTYGQKIDLQIDDDGLDELNKIDLYYYVQNGEFDLLATPAKRISTTFENETYIELYFHLHLKRRVLYYGINWILPSVLISLSNILGFTMPPECGEKITLQITNLLSVTVFLGMVAEVTPPTSESIPVIAAFFSLSIVILGLSIFATLIIINIFFRHPKSHVMGEWTHFIFLEWLPWLLLMSRPEHTFRRPRKSKSSQSRIEEVEEDLEEEKRSLYESAENHIRPRLLVNSQIFSEPSIQCLEDIITLLRKFQRKLEEDEEEEEQILNWRFMAMVIDRLSLFLFTGLILGTTSVVFLATPNLFTSNPIIDKRKLEEDEEEEEQILNWRFMAMVIDRLSLFLFTGLILGTTSVVFLATPNLFTSNPIIDKRKLEEDEEEEEQILNWRFMAMVIDRLSLFLFTGLILGTTSVVFLATPNLFTSNPIIDKV